MFLTGRQAEIVDLAKAEGRVLVEDLAARFSVTPQTIRKDLNDLCDNKVLTRIHGGALIPVALDEPSPFLPVGKATKPRPI